MRGSTEEVRVPGTYSLKKLHQPNTRLKRRSGMRGSKRERMDQLPRKPE